MITRSTINSTIKGKAYEYACVLSLADLLKGIRPFEIVENESLRIAKIRFGEITEIERENMLKSSGAGIKEIIKMEPRIIEDGTDLLVISLQPDTASQKYGDIRDVLIIRCAIKWEIGVSVKHNHAALKHSRLSHKIDFGSIWFGASCSKNYFETIKPIFDNLSKHRLNRKLWSEIDKETVYVGILNAFRDEFISIDKNNENVTENLIRYLLGSNGRDYYKLIHKKNRTASIIPFNLYGTLNKNAGSVSPKISIPSFELPTRIIEFAYKENSKTTLILTMNNGWSISFRIHNASSKVESSLKFDINLISKPENMFYIEVEW